MKIAKSSRHSKITGDFAERLVLYWLSKHGFECALVDHVGLDIIARNPHNQEVMGISVKSRSRSSGTDGSSLSIPNDNLAKLDAACMAFNCKPYFAIVIDEAYTISVFILTKAHLVSISPPGREVISWKMRMANISHYEIDPDIRSFKLSTSTGNWWNEKT
jgi:Holliday junction resolvase-like predicted endonuclease